MENALLLSGSGDVDFMIHGLFSYELFGQTVWITTSHVCILIVMLIILGFGLAVNITMKKATDVPGTFQNIAELVVEMLDGMVKNSMGKNAKYFANYIGTLFIFILMSNISGLIGLRPPTADYGTTLALALPERDEQNTFSVDRHRHFFSLLVHALTREQTALKNFQELVLNKVQIL